MKMIFNYKFIRRPNSDREIEFQIRTSPMDWYGTIQRIVHRLLVKKLRIVPPARKVQYHYCCKK